MRRSGHVDRERGRFGWWAGYDLDGARLARLRVEGWDDCRVAVRAEIGLEGADQFVTAGVTVRVPYRLWARLVDRERRRAR